MTEDLFMGTDLDSLIELSDTPETTETHEKVEVVNEKKKESTEDTPTLIEIPDGPSNTGDEIEEIEEKLPKSKAKEVAVQEETTLDESSPKSKTDSSPWKVFAQALNEEGIISELDEFDETKGAEGLFELVKKEIQSNVENWKSNYPPEVQRILNAVENGVPVNRAIEGTQQSFMYSSINDEALTDNESLQKELIKNDLISRGFEEEDITEELQDYEDTGKLEAKAKRALKNLTKMQAEQMAIEETQAREATKQREEEIKRETETRQKYIEDLKEVIPGNTLNKAVKQKIMDSMFKPAGKDKEGRPVSQINMVRSKDPAKFDTIFHYLLVNGVFEGKFDAISAPVKKSVIKDLENTIRSDSSFKSGIGETKTSEKAKDFIESMRQFTK
jgi:hypothetical protein